MKRKGQLAIFIIIALVFIGLIIALYYLSNKNSSDISGSEGQDPLSQAISETKSLLQGCLDDSLTYSTYIVFSQGGSLNPDNPINLSDLGLVQIGFDKSTKKLTFPTNEQILSEIQSSITENLETCFGIEEFEGKITADKPPEVKIQFSNNAVEAFLTYPITFNFADSTNRYNGNLESTLNIDTSTILSETLAFLETFKEDPESVDLFFIQNSQVDITIIPVDDESTDIIIILEDTDQEIQFSEKESQNLTIVTTVA